MPKRKQKTKAARVEHPSEALQKAEIKTLRRVRAQRSEISRLLRQIHKLGESVSDELVAFAMVVLGAQRNASGLPSAIEVDFSIRVLERSGDYRVELKSDREQTA